MRDRPVDVPARFARTVVAAEEHEVGLEVAATPVARPGPEHLAHVRFGSRVRDVEDVVFLAALVPAELAVERHRRDRLAARPIGDDPIRVLGVQAAAIADHERRNPQARREAFGADVGEQRLHAARKLWLHVEPVAHLGREAVVDLEDVERHLVAIAKLRRRGQMLEDDRFSDRRVQVVPGAPARDAPLMDPRRQRRCLNDATRPFAQRLLDIDTRQQNQRLRFDTVAAHGPIDQRLDVDRQRAFGEREPKATLETIVSQEPEHGGLACFRYERGHRVPDDGCWIGRDDAASSVELDEIAAVPARVAVAQVAHDIGDVADAQSQGVD